MAVDSNRLFVAGGDGLFVVPTLANFQVTLRLDATPGQPFTLETATNLVDPIIWTPLLTTSAPTMPLEYVDFDVKLSEKPQKYYRVRQP